MKRKNKYRIVTDAFAGYEVQIKYWWLPFWLSISSSGCGLGINTNNSVGRAEQLIELHKQRSGSRLVVKVIE